MKFVVREIHFREKKIIRLIAERMRLTLVEVLGEERGGEMFTMDWLIDRVLQHFNPQIYDGAVFVAEDESGNVLGHTITRVEHEEHGHRFGLFSTFYVMPEHRSEGIVDELIRAGEAWMAPKNLASARTYTAKGNEKLHRAMARHGYTILFEKDDMVALDKPFTRT